MPDGTSAVALVVTLLNVTLALATVAFRIVGGTAGEHLEHLPVGAWLIDSLGAVTWSWPGLVIARRRPELPFGWVALAAGLGHGLAGAGLGWATLAAERPSGLPGMTGGLWLGAWTGLMELPALAVIYLLFPRGRMADGWLRITSVASLALVCAGVLTAMLSPFETTLGPDPGGPFANTTNPLAIAFLRNAPDMAAFFAPGLLVACGVVIVRCRRAEGDERQVLRWLAVVALIGPVVVASAILLPAPIGIAVAQLTTFLELATIFAALLRHRVFGIESLLNRAWSLALFTALVAGSYAAAVAFSNQVLPLPGASAVGAVAVALALAPARIAAQRLVNRVMYGQRDEPLAVVTKLSAELTAAASADELLRGVAGSIRSALRVPYVGILVHTDHGPIAFEDGRAKPDAQAQTSLIHRSQEVGVLIVGLRAGEPEFSPAERRLHALLAQQLSSAAAAVALTLALQRSREQLVGAREEERRRIRRELHDGIGTMLTGAALMIDAAHNKLSTDPAVADRYLLDAGANVRRAVEDVRQLSYGLRPPALDELGLVGALRALQDGGPPTVRIETQEPFPQLPAAVEVAAYRIITEAVTNARRHAGATACTVTIRVNRDLEFDVVDDGRGTSRPWQAGVGMSSMRERAAELGGVCQAGPDSDGHGRVSGRIPLEFVLEPTRAMHHEVVPE